MLAGTIWPISVICCPPIMDSTSSLAIFITSMQKKSQKWKGNEHSKKEFPKFFERFGPRGVIHSSTTCKDDPTKMPR
jgi:hypothetical protein